VVKAVKEGFSWTFQLFEPQSELPMEYRFRKEETLAISREIKSMVAKRAVEEDNPVRVPSKTMSYWNLFTVAKKSGGLRPVLNLKHLNNKHHNNTKQQ